jgi:hypothetical protein
MTPYKETPFGIFYVLFSWTLIALALISFLVALLPLVLLSFSGLISKYMTKEIER